MIAIVPAIAVAQPFLPNVGPAVDPNTGFQVVAIKTFNDASSRCVPTATLPVTPTPTNCLGLQALPSTTAKRCS